MVIAAALMLLPNLLPMDSQMARLNLVRVSMVAKKKPVAEILADLCRQLELPAPKLEKGFPSTPTTLCFLNVPALEALTIAVSQVGGRYELLPTSRGEQVSAWIDPLLAQKVETTKETELIADLLKSKGIPFSFPSDLAKRTPALGPGGPLSQILVRSLRDVGFSYSLKGNTVVAQPIRQPGSGDGDHRDMVLVAKYKNRPLSEVLSGLAQSVGATIEVAPEIDVNLPVTVVSPGEAFETLFQSALKQVGLTYRVLGGVYCVIKRTHSF